MSISCTDQYLQLSQPQNTSAPQCILDEKKIVQPKIKRDAAQLTEIKTETEETLKKIQEEWQQKVMKKGTLTQAPQTNKELPPRQQKKEKESENDVNTSR